MKFTLEARRLIDGLQIATRALSARTANPILEGVLVEAYADRVRFTCSDERVTIVTSMDAEIEEEGRGVAPGKLFSELIRRMSEGQAQISMNERFLFTLKSGQFRANLSGQDPELYPRLPYVECDRELTLPEDMLRDMIQKTEFAIAQEDLREVLTGCLLEIEGGEVRMVAVDGFRLAMKTEKCSDALESASAIIPGRAVGDLGKLLSDDPDRFASLSFEGGRLHVRMGDTDMFIVLVEGEFIKYRQILPVKFETRVLCALEPLRRCIDRAALIAREGNNNRVSFDISGNVMVVESNSEIADIREEIDVEQSGADLQIAFNVKYLTDIIRSLDCERLELSFNSPITPCVVTPEGDREYLHLVLPVRMRA